MESVVVELKESVPIVIGILLSFSLLMLGMMLCKYRFDEGHILRKGASKNSVIFSKSSFSATVLWTKRIGVSAFRYCAKYCVGLMDSGSVSIAMSRVSNS